MLCCLLDRFIPLGGGIDMVIPCPSNEPNSNKHSSANKDIDNDNYRDMNNSGEAGSEPLHAAFMDTLGLICNSFHRGDAGHGKTMCPSM